MGSKEEHIDTNRRREPWRAWPLLVLSLVLLASHVAGTHPAPQPAAFTIRLPTQMTGERLLQLARGMSRFRVGSRRPDDMSRLWKDLRTGQEIGGEARDLLRPLGDKTSTSTSGGDKEGGGPLGALRRALKKRSVRLVALVGLLASGGMAVQDRRNGRSPEPFIKQTVDRRLQADKAGRKVVPIEPPPPEAAKQPEAVAPIKEGKGKEKEKDKGGEKKAAEKGVDKGAEKAAEKAAEKGGEKAVEKGETSETVPPMVTEGDTEVVPIPVPPPATSDAVPPLQVIPPAPEAPGKGTQNERKRWTPFRDMRRRAAEAGQRGREEMKGKAAREGKAQEQSPSKEEKQEGLEEARILGQEKEKEREREKAPEQAKVEEQGDKTVQPVAPLAEREAPPPSSDERAPEAEAQEEEEEEEEMENRGIKGGWIDRRGTVLLGTPPLQDAVPPPPPLGGEEVTIPEVGLGSATTRGGQRHGTSFVSSVFRTVGPAVPRVDCVKVYKGEIKFASGSGVIFTPEGHLITNSLLVRNALELKVTLADGREYPAIVKGMDEVLDVAVLKILSNSPPQGLNSGAPPSPPPTFQYAPIGDSDALQVGDWVMSIGSPKSPGPSVILGVVSGLTRTAAEVGRPETQVNFIQTDASFDANVVGGPLVNEFGEVVGINSIGMTTSSTVQFSVPINQIKTVVTDLANGKAVQHPSIGVEMMPITPSLAAQLNNQAKEGSQIVYIPEGGAVVVVNVLEDSPAMEGGLKTLDILLEIERRPIYKVEDAQRIIQSAGVGQDLEIKVLRQSQEVTLRVRTGDFLSLIRKAQNSRGNLHSTDPLGKPRRGIPRDDGADRRSSTPSTPQQQKPLTPPSQQHHEQQQTSPQEPNRGEARSDGPTNRRGPEDTPSEPQGEAEGNADDEPFKGYLYV